MTVFSISRSMDFNLLVISFREIKRIICENLCEGQLILGEKKRKAQESSRNPSENLIINGLGGLSSSHLLLENPANKRVECFFVSVQ